MITAKQIIDFWYENDLVDDDEGDPLTAEDLDFIYELATDPGFVPQHEDLKIQVVQMIRDYREGK